MMGIRMDQCRQRGLTLIELMIAIVLGMLVIGAVAALYVNASRNFREDDQYARMLENGRFAMHFLGEDLQMANFWGYSLTPDRIKDANTTACNGQVQPFHETATEYGIQALDADLADPIPCESDEDKTSAMLLIKRVAGTSIADKGDAPDDYAPGEGSYLVVSPKEARVVTLASGDSVSITSNEWLWKFQSAIYFVTTGEPPELCRVRLDNGSSDRRECLVRGVERMRIEFGIDLTGDDGIPDTFISDNESSLTTSAMQAAYSARVCLLLRSERELTGRDNSNEYNLCGELFTAPGDGYQRRVFEKTFQLRNNASLAAFD